MDKANNIQQNTDTTASNATSTPMEFEDANRKQVIKRNGERQDYDEEKIRVRLGKLLTGLATEHLDINLVLSKITSYIQ